MSTETGILREDAVHSQMWNTMNEAMRRVICNVLFVEKKLDEVVGDAE